MMYPLTTPQQNIWNLQRFYEETSISNNCGAIYFDKNCHHPWINQALNRWIKSQDGMRLRFTEVDGHPMQYVHAYVEEEFPSQYFENQSTFETFARHFAQQRLDLFDAPMYRCIIFDIAGKSGVLLNLSHLISDGWTFGLMPNFVSKIYHSLENDVPLEDSNHSYLSFIESEQKYLNSEKYLKDKAYWIEQYQDYPEECSIKPHCAPVLNAKAKRYTTLVSPELTSAIDRFYIEKNISPAVLFETSLIAYLAKIHPEQSSISIGVPVLNRSNAIEKQTMGMCISTTPLKVSVSMDMTAEALCQTVASRQLKLFRHQRFPYGHILQDVRQTHGFTGKLYDVMVSYQNAKTDTDAKTEWFSNGYSEVGLVFHIDNRDQSANYTLNIDYQTDLFENGDEVKWLVDRILSITTQIIQTPDIQLEALSIVPELELKNVLWEFNQTEADFQRSKCVHELFMAQAQQTPDRLALVFEDQHLTYRQLDEMSNALGHALRQKGIGRGDVVPIISKRSWHLIVAMLAVLKAGGAYLPVDPHFPTERMEDTFQTAQCRFALTCGYSQVHAVETIALEDFDFHHANTSPLNSLNHPEDLCYVIFTSGSTGKPKGVSVCHRNVVNYAENNIQNDVFHTLLGANLQKMVSVTNIVFDIFVTESLFPLLHGLCIYLANDDQVVSQHLLAELVNLHQIEIIQATPTKMRSYLLDKQNMAYLRHLKAIILGGEALPADLYLELRKHTDAKIFNIYGPAESTVWSTTSRVESPHITIGKPIANTRVYILDAHRNLLPIGVAGELCISGEGVGKGYLNRPDLTAERFIANPYMPGALMYCTGDLARWRTDGELEYLGRIDTQVKIRGQRIELGEIESVMRQFSIETGDERGVAGQQPRIGGRCVFEEKGETLVSSNSTVGGLAPQKQMIQLAAVTDKLDKTGHQILVGYYTSEYPVDDAALRGYLGTKLPKYMIPNYFVHLDNMPMTASGKIDRKRLPDINDEINRVERVYIAPQTRLEKLLLSELSTLFETPEIGVTDDFFELGGDSLRAIEYVAKLHHKGLTVALQNIFDYPTARQLAAFLEGREREKVKYIDADFEKYTPLLDANTIDETFVPTRKPLGNVLLTGATGFLGSHILDALMRIDAQKIYCLVRGGKDRLISILEYYFADIYTSEFGHKIEVIDGDLTDEKVINTFPNDIQTVIHSAATVKHYGTYQTFHRVNVEGTKNIMTFAQNTGAQMIHISTLSVSGNSFVDVFDVYRAEENISFSEQSLYVHQPLDNVYIHSKFEAELAILDAMLEGLNAKIIRVGNLTNRTTDFKFQSNYLTNAFLTRFKAMLEFGYFPQDLIGLYAEFSPVDQTADGIVKIAEYAQKQTVFHLNNPYPLYFDRMIDILKSLNIKIEVLEETQFYDILKGLSQDSNQKYIYEAFQNDMNDSGKLVYDSNIRILNDFTVWFMEKLGFKWNETDQEYICGYIEYFRKLGYLEV